MGVQINEVLCSSGKKLQRASDDCCCLAQRYVGVSLSLELPL